MPLDTLRALLTELDLPTSRIVRAIAVAGAATAVEIVQTTGLARSTVSSLVAELRKAGIVIAVDMRPSGMGRPTILLSLNPDAGRCAGVLLGLDEIRVSLCDMAHNVLTDESVVMPRDYAPEAAVETVSATLARHCGALGGQVGDLIGVGLAVSAPVSAEGVVMPGSILPTWSGVNLARIFGPVLGCPVHAENESNCGALAEMTWGHAIGEPDFVMFKCDLGIGGAIVLGGKLRRGFNGAAAEFGHLTLDPNGALCRCGNRGCLETIAGGTHILKLAEEAQGTAVTLADLAKEGRAGHAGYRRLIEDAADTAGWALGLIGTTINPPLFVITGGLALAGDLFMNRLKQSYERFAMSRPSLFQPDKQVRFVAGKFLSNDTVLGAVALVLRQEAKVC